MAKLYIFDKDGTIMTKKGGGDPPIPNSIEGQIALPGVVEKCAELRAQGHIVAIASNAGGIAWSFLTAEAQRAIMRHAADLVGATDWQYCPHHPKAPDPYLGQECLCRKPKPGMLLAIMTRLGFEAADTIFVGDMDTDRQAAEAAGVRFIHADEFFDRKETQP